MRRLLEQGRNKDRLRLSTIRDYYLGVAHHLYEAAWAVSDFAALDDDELEDLYSQALDETTWKQRPATAKLLQDVHTTMRRLYPGTPSIDFHGIEPRLQGRSVRSNLLTLAEYARAREQLDLSDRVALTCLYRLGLRPGELRRLGPEDGWLDAESVLLVRSRRGATTKTLAGQRQIPLTGRLSAEEGAELGQLVARCRDAGAAQLSRLMPQDVLARITTAIREASGDYTLVPYHLRHAARTQMLLWVSTGADGSLPGAAPPAALIDGPAAFRRVHFGSDVPTRRSGYQEAVVAGHTSPATTYGTYMHALDWICHQAVLRDHPIETALLAHLSGFSQANVRQIRRRSGGAVGAVRAVLKQGGLPSPPEWRRMIPVEESPTRAPPGRPRAGSLLDVAEAIRLWAGGQPIPGIAIRLDYTPLVVTGWIEAAQRVTRQSGYPAAALSQEPSFEGREMDAVGQALSDLICASTTPPPEWWRIQRELWCQRYIHRLAMPYFSDMEELFAWVGGLLRLSVAGCDIRLLAPRNVSDDFIAAATSAVGTLGVEAHQVRRQDRSVNARSAAASRDPGIGVFVTQGPGRKSLAQLLARWMYCAATAHESAA